MRSSKYDAAMLAPLVASSHSLAQVIRRLGLRPTGGMYRFLRARIRAAGLDTSHWGGTLRVIVESIPVERLTALVRESSSLAQMLVEVGLPTEGRAHHELEKRITALGIDTSHMTGAAWSRGYTKDTHPSLARISKKARRTDAELFCASSRTINDGPRLIRRLLELGWAYECRECGISEWRGQPLVLHLDHINGIANDNRMENLRLLCPNCHSQTDTYCNRRRPTPSRASEPRARYTCYTSGRCERGGMVDTQRLGRCA